MSEASLIAVARPKVVRKKENPNNWKTNADGKIVRINSSSAIEKARMIREINKLKAKNVKLLSDASKTPKKTAAVRASDIAALRNDGYAVVEIIDSPLIHDWLGKYCRTNYPSLHG